MNTKKRSNAPIILFCTGLIFILLFLTTLISNWIIIMGVRAGLITGRPGTPLFPFLIQTGIVSILIGVLLTLVLSHFPLRPLGELMDGIHAVAGGDFHTKIHLKHPKAFRDLSESFNQMTDELAGIELLRSDFINNFSHEFKTPIASILGFARLLKKETVSEKKRAQYLDIIISECRRLSALSSNVLSLSKVESISVLADVAACPAAEQIREAILQLEQKWEKKEIEFDLHLADCRIHANPDLLKQVWVNLIDNAVKFSPPGGVISIRAGRECGSFFFRITDQGAGMDPGTQEKIFDRFFQGDLSHATEGNGLGLCLVKKIVSLHRGAVHVSSRPGEGSTFTVTLPQP